MTIDQLHQELNNVNDLILGIEEILKINPDDQNAKNDLKLFKQRKDELQTNIIVEKNKGLLDLFDKYDRDELSKDDIKIDLDSELGKLVKLHQNIKQLYLDDEIIKSNKKVLFNSDDFEYNLFYSSSKFQLLMDDIIYKYLMQCNQNTFQTLVKLYGIDNVKRVANNIRIEHGYEIYKILKTKYLDKFEENGSL